MAEDTHRNRILARLGSHELSGLKAELEAVTFSFKEPLYEQGRPAEYVYFPTEGVLSLVTDLDDGQVVETGTVGREGMVGMPVFLGSTTAPWRALCQIPGRGFRMEAAAFKTAVKTVPRLEDAIMRYANALLSMLAQNAACNRAHSVEERMSKWLLTTRDRVDADDFPLTQEFLGQMLGVRRPTVSLAGSLLQRAGLIRYSRGRIAIVDRAGLEAASCECYAFIRQQLDRALPDTASVVGTTPTLRESAS
jgi:CRP-like cAMP-binding protein